MHIIIRRAPSRGNGGALKSAEAETRNGNIPAYRVRKNRALPRALRERGWRIAICMPQSVRKVKNSAAVRFPQPDAAASPQLKQGVLRLISDKSAAEIPEFRRIRLPHFFRTPRQLFPLTLYAHGDKMKRTDGHILRFRKNREQERKKHTYEKRERNSAG